jgi:formylglycine-generating enzyme required for sulfatase activity
LVKFGRRQAHEITDSRWKFDVGQLIQHLEQVPGVAAPARPEVRSPQGVLSPGALPQEIRNSIGMELVLIPAGEFLMGAADGEDNECPVHRVQISQPFSLGKYPVTQAQWEAVMDTNPSYFRGNPNRPVEQVSWDDAQEFLHKLSAREGGMPYRLPTEAEWEYAARAGATTAYSFGDDPALLGEYAWYIDNSEGSTHPVGQRKPNAWGLYDMHGNVWEWVQDWYAKSYYQHSPARDPLGSDEEKAAKVVRGGAWDIIPKHARITYRYAHARGKHDIGRGFRCAR